MSVSSAANSARSVHVSLGRAGVCRCRTASWWRSRRISASFHAGGRLDSRSHAGIWTARRNTKRRHTRRDHRRPGCLTASRQHPDDLPVRDFRQPQVTQDYEGACRFVIEDGSGITGARWSPDGAETILKLRAVVVNGDLDAYMNYYKNRYRSEHHLSRYDPATIEDLNLAA